MELPSKEYEWVVFTPDLFNDTRLVRLRDDPSEISVVARLIYNDGREIPCEGRINLEEKTIEPIVQHYDKKTPVQVLLIESGKVKWIPSSNGAVSDNAIVGGKSQTKEKLYVCMKHVLKSTKLIGTMEPSTQSCHGDYFSPVHENYKLLIHEA
ncbi:hypothetical protein PV325_008267 [Microctonus aethiopoides]|uniref:Uncharacterized protein n=1 Tax=Microctonus aethiopoides TaxID=144406 RepID=A0AA39F9M8_9HYME|nr:hypothetical protein PV325_008267 [Microctonus aethiopoides]KAK0165471.1 hypothetical protein PV328_003978 [Microctonus aethiopoides]